MSRDVGKLVVTYTLPRDEDPALFDHLALFRKGRARTARLKTLVRNGLMLEHIRGGASDASPQGAAAHQDHWNAAMDQIFAPVKG